MNESNNHETDVGEVFEQNRKDSLKLFTSHIASNHQPSPYLRRFRLPSLNASPTASLDDLISPDLEYATSPVLPPNNQSAMYTTSSSQPNSARGYLAAEFGAGANTRRSNSCDGEPSSSEQEPHSSYATTLKQLADLKLRSRYGSSSDYFSMTSSMCSDTEEDEMIQSTSSWLSMNGTEKRNDWLRSRGILAEISAETAALEQRNRELLLSDDDDVTVAAKQVNATNYGRAPRSP